MGKISYKNWVALDIFFTKDLKFSQRTQTILTHGQGSKTIDFSLVVFKADLKKLQSNLKVYFICGLDVFGIRLIGFACWCHHQKRVMLKNTTTPQFKHQNNEIVEFQVTGGPPLMRFPIRWIQILQFLGDLPVPEWKKLWNLFTPPVLTKACILDHF